MRRSRPLLESVYWEMSRYNPIARPIPVGVFILLSKQRSIYNRVPVTMLKDMREIKERKTDKIGLFR